MVPDSAISDAKARHIRRACADLADRLRAGEDCRAEAFLAADPEALADADAALELIYLEFTVREELGQEPARADWFARFPQWRERLERLFEIGVLLDEVSDWLHDSDLPNPTTVADRPRLDRPNWNGDTPTANPAASPGVLHAAPAPWTDEYELLEKIGRGGMGVVFKARQLGLNRDVALKAMLAGDNATPAERARFRREAENMARLHHPNIVPVHAVGERDGCPFFTMEFVAGGSLARSEAAAAGAGIGKEGQQWAAKLVATVARAVHYAHQQGIIHRDLKPANIVLTADGVPKVADFGLSKCLEGESGAVATEKPTPTGLPLGTAGYIAPEQAAGKLKEIGPRTDVYALGAILYELLTGQPPFSSESFLQSVQDVQAREPRRPRTLNRRVDLGLEAVCLKCLEKQPGRRYASAEALADDLERWGRGAPTMARPRRWYVRLGRAMRRHWVVSAAAALMMLSTGTAFTVAYVRDPLRQMEYNQRELRQDRPVTLIGEKGPPDWFQWRASGGTTEVAKAEDGTFLVKAAEFGLLELLPDPQCQHYRLSAEVRQDITSKQSASGAIGIYFARGQSSTLEGEPWNYCCTVEFNDLPGGRKINPHEIDPQFPNRESYIVALNLRRFAEPPNERKGKHVTCRQHFRPVETLDLRTMRTWHRLVVEVTPTTIRVFWDEQAIGELPRPGLVKRIRGFRLGPVDPQPEFSPRGGLGIFVNQMAASFRRVKIEPLVEGN